MAYVFSTAMRKTSQLLALSLSVGVGSSLPWVYNRIMPSPPSVVFLGGASPQDAIVGKPITIGYEDVQRNEACSADVIVRWRKDNHGLPGPLIAQFERDGFSVVQADPLPYPKSFEAQIPILPPEIPGVWWYSPIIQPGDDCGNKSAIIPPPMRLTVRADNGE